jgi:hypothetical protein
MKELGIQKSKLHKWLLARGLSLVTAFVVIFSMFILPAWPVSAAPSLTWETHTAAEANSWQDVVWSPELGLFVAVATTGTNRVMTSPDGFTWTARSAAAANPWSDVIWSPALNLFVAVASSGTNRVMTSPDGITWTGRSADASGWIGIAWSPALNLFVATGNSGANRVMTSPNGITWTLRTAAEANLWGDVVWSPELNLFVAISISGTNQVMTSPDGITWTARATAAANAWRSVVWSPELGLFVAVANSGTNRVMTSPDGITWASRAGAASSYGWSLVAWSPELGLFVSAAFDKIMTSPDGINWTGQTPVTNNSWSSITWSPELNRFVAVAGPGTYRVMTGSPRYEVVVTPADNLTGEDGDTGTFKVSLSYPSSAPVTIALSSSNTNEGTVPASITIQPGNWDNPDANVVTVTGINDGPPVSDGAVQYTIVTGDVTSSDTHFNALTGYDVADVTMYNQNDDAPGINNSATFSLNTTTEAGGCTVVDFELLSQPTNPVTIPLSISDSSEGTLGGVTQIIIQPADWDQPQNNEVTVCGLDDSVADGDVQYFLVTGDPTSSDPVYDALGASDIADTAITNTDNELADDDNDGILNSTENAAPNFGDANNDGTFDSAQANVGSFACQITSVSMTAESGLAVSDSGFDYPVGLMNFTVNCSTAGFVTTVTQYYYGATGSSFVLRKHNPNMASYFAVTGATLQQVTIGGLAATMATYQATDGGELDTDATLDGIIVDPVGLAQNVVGVPNTGLGGRP